MHSMTRLFGNINRPCWLLSALLLMASGQAAQAEEHWQALFDGKTFANWKQLGGAAEYTIENGEIVGTSKANTPNSFMTTTRLYGDFILEFDVKLDAGLNSGVQIRSNSRSNYLDGRVHGYQVEIDTSARAFSGGIYDESRRGWMYPLTRNDAARSAFRNGEWNHYRIEAIGNRISTWVNGQQAARLVDALESEGFIALQVHSTETPEQVNGKIHWRNIRIQTTNLAQNATPDHPAVEEISFLTNTLTDTERRKGWRLLWDGKTTQGWQTANAAKLSASGWQINQGALATVASAAAQPAADLISEQQFRDFELQLEFKLANGSESGVQYLVGADASGPEFQIIDDAVHPDAKQGVKGNRSLGSLYDLIAAENLSIAGRNKQFKPGGEWNHVRILVRNGQVEHWLNNEKVIAYDRTSQMFKALVSYSQFRDLPQFGQQAAGRILLQNKGTGVQFRNIKIRE